MSDNPAGLRLKIMEQPSNAKILNLLTHPVFAGRMQRRLGAWTAACIVQNCLRVTFITKGQIPKEWFRTLTFQLRDPEQNLIAQAKVETAYVVSEKEVRVVTGELDPPCAPVTRFSARARIRMRHPWEIWKEMK